MGAGRSNMQFAGDAASRRGLPGNFLAPQGGQERMESLMRAKGSPAFGQPPGSIRNINTLKNTGS